MTTYRGVSSRQWTVSATRQRGLLCPNRRSRSARRAADATMVLDERRFLLADFMPTAPRSLPASVSHAARTGATRSARGISSASQVCDTVRAEDPAYLNPTTRAVLYPPLYDCSRRTSSPSLSYLQRRPTFAAAPERLVPTPAPALEREYRRELKKYKKNTLLLLHPTPLLVVRPRIAISLGGQALDDLSA